MGPSVFPSTEPVKGAPVFIASTMGILSAIKKKNIYIYLLLLLIATLLHKYK